LRPGKPQGSKRRAGRGVGGTRTNHEIGGSDLAVKLVLLYLAGVCSGTTRLRKISGNRVDYVVIRHR